MRAWQTDAQDEGADESAVDGVWEELQVELRAQCRDRRSHWNDLPLSVEVELGLAKESGHPNWENQETNGVIIIITDTYN